MICIVCDRRALVEVERVRAFKGNMASIGTLRLKCSQCGARSFQLVVFYSQEEEDAFIPKPRERTDPLF